jgi:hypothetical protein
MAQPTSPSPPHRSPGHPEPHVDLRGINEKIHVPVQNNLGATAIGAFQQAGARAEKGRP